MQLVGLDPLDVALVSAFSLAWFIVGIAVGGRLPRRPAGSRRSRSSSSPSSAPSRGEGEVELYVGNLAYEISERDLAKAFEPYGRVASSRIIQNKFNGKSKGYGFIEMGNAAAATAAVKAMNGRDIKGRKIVVNEAKTAARDN